MTMIKIPKRMQQRFARACVALAATSIGMISTPLTLAAADADVPPSPSGVWRGTSTCTDLKAAPNCHDEVVVYEFAPGAKAGTIQWKADKIVNGERRPMGELELTYDPGLTCWKAEFRSPRSEMAWCLKIEGSHMTGSGWHLPGKEIVRKIDVLKE